jgi:vacuolar-type H+-ATPase subunit E/Vma4
MILRSAGQIIRMEKAKDAHRIFVGMSFSKRLKRRWEDILRCILRK